MYFRSAKKTAQDVSIHEPIETDSEGNPLTLEDLIFTEDTIVDDIQNKINRMKIRKAVNAIKNKRDKKIIILRYGLDGKDAKTQQEVADLLKISRSYVSRIESRVLSDLRKFMEN